MVKLRLLSGYIPDSPDGRTKLEVPSGKQGKSPDAYCGRKGRISLSLAGSYPYNLANKCIASRKVQPDANRSPSPSVVKTV